MLLLQDLIWCSHVNPVRLTNKARIGIVQDVSSELEALLQSAPIELQLVERLQLLWNNPQIPRQNGWLDLGNNNKAFGTFHRSSINLATQIGDYYSMDLILDSEVSRERLEIVIDPQNELIFAKGIRRIQKQKVRFLALV